MSLTPQHRRNQGEGDADWKSLAFELKGGAEAPLAARRALVADDGSLPLSVREDILLLMTELVTNAVRHGGAGPGRWLSTEVHWRPGKVCVQVTDPSTALAEFGARSDAASAGGWGLFLVEHIAHRWGVERRPSGTTVWFELRPE